MIIWIRISTTELQGLKTDVNRKITKPIRKYIDYKSTLVIFPCHFFHPFLVKNTIYSCNLISEQTVKVIDITCTQLPYIGCLQMESES